MPLPNSCNLPNSHVLLRGNSLPSYEQATGLYPQGETGEVVPSATLLSIVTQNCTVNQSGTSHHSTDYTPIPQVALRNPDIEQALYDLSPIQHHDPVARQLAEAILEECRRAKEKRIKRVWVNVTCAIIGLFLFLIGLALGSSKGR